MSPAAEPGSGRKRARLGERGSALGALGALGDLGDVRVGLPALSTPVHERPRVEPQRRLGFVRQPAWLDDLPRNSMSVVMQMSVELGKDVFAEESYLFDEIGQTRHFEVRPSLECEGVGE